MDSALKTEEVEFIVGYIRPDLVWRLWRKVEPLISSALHYSNGEIDTPYVRDALLAGKMQLFLVARSSDKKIFAAATTEIGIYPKKRVLRITTLGGKDFHSWGAQFVEAMEKFAAEWELDYIEGAMRPGWEKWLPALGWKKSYILMTKEVK